MKHDSEIVRSSELSTVHIGDVVDRSPHFLHSEKDSPGKEWKKGKVIYVHPKGRFHVVEFDSTVAPIKESFLGICTQEIRMIPGKSHA